MKFFLLLKFGERQHLEDFRLRGAAYMNSIEHFKTLEDDAARGDPLENTTLIIQPKHIGSMVIDVRKLGLEISINPIDMVRPVEFGLSDVHHSNLFCLYCLDRPTDVYPIDPRVQEFGDSFVMVTNTSEFLFRFKTAVRKARKTAYGKKVEYYNAMEHSGETGPLRKSDEYDWQREYRFVLRPGSAHPITLLLGSLLDITTPIRPSADIGLLDIPADKFRELGIPW